MWDAAQDSFCERRTPKCFKERQLVHAQVEVEISDIDDERLIPVDILEPSHALLAQGNDGGRTRSYLVDVPIQMKTTKKG